MAASTGAGRSRLPGQDRKENPPAIGRESASCPGSMLPLASARSGQRSPGVSSAASASSRPPPHGSPSTSSTRTPSPAAAWAIQMAAVVAPAPPQPPVTPRTRPPASGERDRLRYSASQAAASGSTATRSAPRAAARCQRLSPSPFRPTSTAGARRRGRQFTDIAAHQHGGRGVPVPCGLHDVCHHTQLPPAAATIRSTSPCRKSDPVTSSTSAASVRQPRVPGQGRGHGHGSARGRGPLPG